MKRLVRLLLINWYRLEQVSIEIEGHAAFIGPNASGKSSLLDAIQAVLVGGDKRWWNPNASAGEKSTRSLRDYCLGVVRDPNNPDLSQEFRPRDQSITYLVLVFHDENNEAISVGLAMHARLDDAQETIDGRFIAPGLDLILSDLVDRTDEGVVPKPWKRLREDLRMRSGEEFRVHSQVGEYQRHICAVLSDGKRHLDVPRFLRAFKNAITFSPIRNVSDFVRSHILEERPIQVRSLQQALQNYRDIQTRTSEAKIREDALSDINKNYHRAEQAEKLGVAWGWVEKEAAFNGLEAELEPLRDGIEKDENLMQTLEKDINNLNELWNKADKALREANSRLAATDVQQQRKRIDAEKRFVKQILTDTELKIKNSRKGLGCVHQVLDYADYLNNSVLVSTLQRIPPLVQQDEGLLTSPWPVAPADIMDTIFQLKPLLKTSVDSMSDNYDNLVRLEGELRRSLESTLTRIKRLESGESDLSSSTLKLIKLLDGHGIKSVPLCDRVDVDDEQWRDALEAFLGGHREALLISPDQVRDAIGVYRREGKKLGIYGSRIINTLKTDKWLDRRTKKSLAEVIVSDDRHAIAYINLRAGNVLRVESEYELIGQDRAITADGMLATGGSILRLRPEEPMLGREAKKKKLYNLKQRRDEESKTQHEKQEEMKSVKWLREQLLMPLAKHVDEMPDLLELTSERKLNNDEIKNLDKQEEALLNDTEYQVLVDEETRCSKERESINNEREIKNNRKNELNLSVETERMRLAQAEEKSCDISESRTQIQKLAGFDAQLATERMDELLAQELFADESVASWNALEKEALSRSGKQKSKSQTQRTQAREQLSGYWLSWSSENRPIAGSPDDYQPLAAWVIRELRQIQETQLAQYATEAENALREAEHAFRSDFVGKLQENLNMLDDQLKELNRNLKNRPFHGQYYRFVKQTENDLKDVHDWVLSWSPEQAGDVGGLFDTADDPNNPHGKAIARVRNLLMEAAGTDDKSGADWNDRLADYRQYFSFDVRMSDDKDGKGNPEYLSRRLGKGSGGEHQSPFYVAIGAALAAAYRIERKEDGSYIGGMGLAVFDEAFSKLDLQNTVSALGFLDELGLQVLLAAPDEKYGQIAEHVDTIVNVYRDGAIVHIDAEYIKPTAKQILSSDNPVLRPESE